MEKEFEFEHETEERENTITITISRNSDGEILRVAQGTSIFAGIATVKDGQAFSIVLNEAANGGEILCAAEAAENAIRSMEKEDVRFKIIRELIAAKKNGGRRR